MFGSQFSLIQNKENANKLEKKSIKTLSYCVLFSVFLIAISACSNGKPDINAALLEQDDASGESYSSVISKEKPTVEVKDAKTAQSNIMRGGGYAKIGKPYKIDGKWYYPERNEEYEKVGQASWYGEQFHGRTTANGEKYDMYHFTAAHPTMPLPSYARVTNLDNGSSMIVRVNDRGPYAKNRIIDLSMQTATMLGYKDRGTAKVKVEYMGKAPIDGKDDEYLMASFQMGNDKSSLMQAMLDQKTDANASLNAVENITKKAIVKPNDEAEKPKSSKTSWSFLNIFKKNADKTEADIAFNNSDADKAIITKESYVKADILDNVAPNLPQIGPILAQKPMMVY